MLLFHRDRPKFLWVCFRLTVTSQLRCGSADPYSLRTRLERALRIPRPSCAPSHADTELCCIPATLKSAHSALAASSAQVRPKAPICCQDFEFLSQQHLLIIEPAPYSRFPFAQWLWPQVDFLLRTRLKLLLCFLCKLTLQLLSRWNIHVLRHPSSLYRAWMCMWINSGVSTAACTNVAVCLQTKSRGSLLESASWLLLVPFETDERPASLETS